jgi:hypothetical protein
MILTTLVASVVYAWIEGFAIQQPRYEATQVWWFLGHFSTYSVAMGILFACITGGFGLLQARSMFTKGKKYFLFTFAGNYPFSWLVEDFAFFWFSPGYRLTSDRWTNWFLGGVWILDPWRTGVKIWIPTWYLLVLLFWIAMMWYAHRCTVYDNLVKDEIAREIVPRKIEIPRVEVKKPEPSKIPERIPPSPPQPPSEAPEAQVHLGKVTGIPEEAAPKAEQVTVEPPTGKREIPQAPTEAPEPEQPPTQQPTLEAPRRSSEAQEALRRLRQKWLKNGSNANNTS